jgi:hypothetical protein
MGFRASADNWMLLTRAMKAHQMSCIATEEELELWLADCPRRTDEIVNNLIVLFDARSVALETELAREEIRVFRALPYQ